MSIGENKKRNSISKQDEKITRKKIKKGSASKKSKKQTIKETTKATTNKVCVVLI